MTLYESRTYIAVSPARGQVIGRIVGPATRVVTRIAGVAVRGDLAGHRLIGVQRAVLGERAQSREAAPAGDDGEALDAVRVRLVGRTTRFSSRSCSAMDARSWASAASSGGVLRTFSSASASRQSGMSRIAGSCMGAMWFIRISHG